ncbi:uncharacterized protein LOC104911853 [Meleagris gallopavo]|uniref:uncharacterized protein LOC104911853 n=1 Tax=Meleagris gallopavo TaxID=9103 RepID=UPI000549DE5C|nr:uncharacterized protein LOC104911853 [Meleagris gallopavo]
MVVMVVMMRRTQMGEDEHGGSADPDTFLLRVHIYSNSCSYGNPAAAQRREQPGKAERRAAAPCSDGAAKPGSAGQRHKGGSEQLLLPTARSQSAQFVFIHGYRSTRAVGDDSLSAELSLIGYQLSGPLFVSEQSMGIAPRVTPAWLHTPSSGVVTQTDVPQPFGQLSTRFWRHLAEHHASAAGRPWLPGGQTVSGAGQPSPLGSSSAHPQLEPPRRGCAVPRSSEPIVLIPEQHQRGSSK